MKLNICCGTVWLPGWINVDREDHAQICTWARAQGKPEPVLGSADYLRYDLTRNWPWVADSADEILADNCLEHFSHLELVQVLREAFKVLKPGGTMTGRVPDFARIWQYYEDGADWQWGPECAVGPYELPGENALHNFCYGWGHKQIFTAPMLRQWLECAGFAVEIEPCETQGLRYTATKPTEAKP